MASKHRSLKKFLLLAVLLAAALPGLEAPAWATSHQVIWDTKDDFERGPSTRKNIDTTTITDQFTIGLEKEPVTGAEMVFGPAGTIYSIGAERKSIAIVATATNSRQIIPLQTRAAGLVFNADKNKLYVGSYNDNNITVINLDNLSAVPTTVVVGKGAYPVAVLSKGSDYNKVYVANTLDRTVSVVDGSTDAVIATLEVIDGPFTAITDPAEQKVFLTNKYNNTVTTIDGATNTISAKVAIEDVVGVIGGPDAGNRGLRVNTAGITAAADKVHLKVKCARGGAGQKIEFQIRTALTEAGLDGLPYVGPGQITTTSWEPTCVEGDDIVLDAGLAPFMELQVKLSSDATVFPYPSVDTVTLDFETYPDLVVESCPTHPATALVGEPFTISNIVIKNKGSEDAVSSVARVYLSSNGVDTFLCDAATPALAAGQSASVSCTGTVADGLLGPYGIKVVADAALQVTEGDENNTRVCSPGVTVVQPDLILGNVTGPPSAYIGDTVSFGVEIGNIGTAPSGTSRVGVTLIDGSGRRVWGGASIPPIAEGFMDIFNVTLLVPDVTPGPYTVEFCADADYVVREIREDNNCTTKALEIKRRLPDLLIVAGDITAPSEGIIGQNITVTAKVTNAGAGSASAFAVAFNLVNGSTGASTRLDCGISVPGVAANGAYTGSTSCLIPASLKTGEYYLEGVADPVPSQVEETNESNNTTRGPNITLYTVLPDLVVSDVQYTLLPTGAMTFTVTVKNYGTTAANYVYTNLYLSLDQNITASDIGMSNINFGTIPARGTVTKTISYPTFVRNNIQYGNYYVGAVVTQSIVNESDLTNNTKFAATTQYLYCDLELVAFSGVMNADGTMSYTATVRNNGNVITSDTRMGYYLSKDTTITTSDVYINQSDLGPSIPSSTLNPGQSVSFSGTVTLLTNNVVGDSYYVGALVDYNNNTPEPNSTDNGKADTVTGLQTVSTDLVVTNVSGSIVNGTLSYNVTVSNIGNAPASDPPVRIYLSSDSNITTSDNYVTWKGAGYIGLTPGGSVVVSDSVAVPANIAAGSYYLGAIVNPIVNNTQSIKELVATNNSKAGVNQVTR